MSLFASEEIAERFQEQSSRDGISNQFEGEVCKRESELHLEYDAYNLRDPAHRRRMSFFAV